MSYFKIYIYIYLFIYFIILYLIYHKLSFIIYYDLFSMWLSQFYNMCCGFSKLTLLKKNFKKKLAFFIDFTRQHCVDCEPSLVIPFYLHFIRLSWFHNSNNKFCRLTLVDSDHFTGLFLFSLDLIAFPI